MDSPTKQIGMDNISDTASIISEEPESDIEEQPDYDTDGDNINESDNEDNEDNEDDEDDDDNDDNDDEENEDDKPTEIDDKMPDISILNSLDYTDKPNKKTSNIDYYDSDSEEDEEAFFKFKKSNIQNELLDSHSNLNQYNNDEINKLSQLYKENNIIKDVFHKTNPILTKYEKTRILGFRAKQINLGNQPFIDVPDGLIDGYEIALLELEQKKNPFIIRRPLPNGKSEFWKVSDLEII